MIEQGNEKRRMRTTEYLRGGNKQRTLPSRADEVRETDVQQRNQNIGTKCDETNRDNQCKAEKQQAGAEREETKHDSYITNI